MNDVVRERKVYAPVILDFVPTSGSIRLNQDADNSVSPSISMKLRLSGNDNVSTQDGKSLNDIEWSISVYRGPSTNERIKTLNAIGLLNYFPARDHDDYQRAPAASAWAHIEGTTFDLLQTFVMSGRLPSYVRVHADGGGIRYGGAPDGSEKVWHVEAEAKGSENSKDWVAVSQLEMTLGVGETEDDETINSPHRPVSADDLHNLQTSIQASLVDYLSSIKSWLGWVLVATAATAIIEVVTHWGK